MKNLKSVTIMSLFSFAFSIYNIGDQMSEYDQNFEYDVCYGEYPTETFNFSDYNGMLNGGGFNITIIGISATW
ncbi:MAG: hypothetical protein H8E72_07075 [Candidatus Marinimicrobia bacterium]|nr:hypothetical protein [Candidatus Neomarinimicrobiota bacterium]